MGRKTDSIRYIYQGPKTVCGLVDAMPFRGVGPPVGLGPFTFYRTDTTMPGNQAGSDYEDYVLNRQIVDAREQASNVMSLVRACGVPADWKAASGPELDRLAEGKPSCCALMAAKNILVLRAYRNGCPS